MSHLKEKSGRQTEQAALDTMPSGSCSLSSQCFTEGTNSFDELVLWNTFTSVIHTYLRLPRDLQKECMDEWLLTATQIVCTCEREKLGLTLWSFNQQPLKALVCANFYGPIGSLAQNCRSYSVKGKFISMIKFCCSSQIPLRNQVKKSSSHWQVNYVYICVYG